MILSEEENNRLEQLFSMLVKSKFRSKFKPIWLDLKKSVNPDFGACDECVKHIKLKQVQRHEKFLENSDPHMWDFHFE